MLIISDTGSFLAITDTGKVALIPVICYTFFWYIIIQWFLIHSHMETREGLNILTINYSILMNEQNILVMLSIWMNKIYSSSYLFEWTKYTRKVIYLNEQNILVKLSIWTKKIYFYSYLFERTKYTRKAIYLNEQNILVKLSIRMSWYRATVQLNISLWYIKLWYSFATLQWRGY